MSNHCYVPCVGKVGRVLAQENNIITVLFFTNLDDEVLGYDASNESIRDFPKSQVTFARVISLEMFQSRKSFWPSFVYYSTHPALATDNQDTKVLVSKFIGDSIQKSFQMHKASSVVHLDLSHQMFEEFFEGVPFGNRNVKTYLVVPILKFSDYSKENQYHFGFLRAFFSKFFLLMPSEAEDAAKSFQNTDKVIFQDFVTLGRFNYLKVAVEKMAEVFSIHGNVDLVYEHKMSKTKQMKLAVFKGEEQVQKLQKIIGPMGKQTRTYKYFIEDRRDGDPHFCPKQCKVRLMYYPVASKLTIKFKYVVRNKVNLIVKC